MVWCASYSSLEAVDWSLLKFGGEGVKLMLVMPATNYVGERSFSALCRIKSYLTSTVTQERLNHLMILHIHREIPDNLDLKACANAFVEEDPHRLSIFWKVY